MEGWKPGESYTDQEWDEAAAILNRNLAADFRPEGVMSALREIMEEVGSVYLQDIEGMLDLYGWPVTLMALPHHCVPNDMCVRLPNRKDREADYWVNIMRFNPEVATRMEVVEEAMNCSYLENLEHLKRAGGVFEAPGRINSFSRN